MKRALLLTAALTVLLGLGTPARQAQAAVSVGLSFGSGRHGGFSLNFSSRPNVVLVPSSRVYYVSDLDQDLYCYGNEWYYVDDGAWYMAPSYNGPFVQIAFTSVPYEIRSVPVRYRRHWNGYTAPVYRQPTYRNRTWNNVVNRTWNDRDWNDRNRDGDDRGNGRGHGRGHGRGNGHGNHGRGR
jgi:hypothetical protein